MARFNLHIDYRTAVWSRMVQSLGMAFLFVPISAVAFAFIPKERTNYATGLFNLARNIGGSSGIATVTTLLARRAQFHQQILVAHMTPYDAAVPRGPGAHHRHCARARRLAAGRRRAGPGPALRNACCGSPPCWHLPMLSG